MQSLAQSWLIYRLTGSPLLLGLVGFVSQVPVLDSSSRRRACGPLVTSPSPLDHSDSLPPSGDDPRRTHAERAHHDRLDHGARGSLGSHQRARYAGASILHCRLVPRADLPSAIGLNSSAFNAARIIGPSVAGFLVAAVGEGVCFLVNALSFLAVIGCLLAMEVPQKAKAAQAHAIIFLAEGLRYAGTRRMCVRSLH